MKVNFKALEVEVSFGEYKCLDISKPFANFIHSRTSDIGLDDIARCVYYSDGEVEIEDVYLSLIVEMVKDPECPFLAGIKKAVIKALTVVPVV